LCFFICSYNKALTSQQVPQTTEVTATTITEDIMITETQEETLKSGEVFETLRAVTCARCVEICGDIFVAQ